MIKRLLFSLWCVLAVSVAEAQLNMTLQVPPTGVLLKNQLWNMILVSGYPGNTDVTVSLSLQDVQTNQVLLTGTSRTIHLAKGATQLQAGDLSPVQYNYYSSIFNNDRDPNGMLPAGNYLACYAVSTTTHISVLTENCINVNVEPLSPPLLNMPTNEAVLTTSYPQFSWLPPTPVHIFSDLNYDMVLVEVLPGQSSTEAIQNNVPVNNMSRTRDQFYNYPASGRQLDTGRLYAWRILARNSSAAIAFSEIWTFRIQPSQTLNNIQGSGNYIVLKRSGEPAGVYNIDTNVVRIRYYSFDKTHQSEVKLLSADGRLIKSFTQQIVYGDNFLSYMLSGTFNKGQLYTIEITDSNNSGHVASFRMR